MTTHRILRTITAGLLLAGGVVHLRLYENGYRSFPDPNLGRSFLLNAAASAVVAVLLVIWRSRLALLAGLAIVNGTLLGFTLSRTSRGVFGFTEAGLHPSPDALLSLIVEITAAAILVWLVARETTMERHHLP